MSGHAVHVAVGVVRNAADEILIARRPDGVHQGGKWEFPGGKLRPGETVEQALRRELEEELGITVAAARPLIQVHHAYPDKTVWLDVWQVETFSGTPHGREDQPVRWAPASTLERLEFPAADAAILQAIRLPDRYLITGAFDSESCLAEWLERSLHSGIRLVQFRARERDEGTYAGLARRVIAQCHEQGVRVLLNADPALARRLDADGVHLNSQRLMTLNRRPLAPDKLVAASVHTPAELRQACRCEVDFSVIGPVQPTRSHPGAPSLGWDGFARLAKNADHPVYALGGLGPQDLPRIWQEGGQGVAAIRSLWGR